MRKQLYKFEFSWQAELVQGLLKNEGIESFSLKGAREYTAIVTGMGQEAPVEIYVEETQFDSALKILNDYFKKSKIRLVDNESEDLPAKAKNYFRNIIFLSLAGAVFLPVIFNISAGLNYLRFLKQKPELKQKTIATIILIAGWVGAFAEIFWFLKTFR